MKPHLDTIPKGGGGKNKNRWMQRLPTNSTATAVPKND